MADDAAASADDRRNPLTKVHMQPLPLHHQEELQAWAERELPTFMRPRHLRIVDDIPRTPTNKVEKYKLRRQILGELGREAPAGDGGRSSARPG